MPDVARTQYGIELEFSRARRSWSPAHLALRGLIFFDGQTGIAAETPNEMAPSDACAHQVLWELAIEVLTAIEAGAELTHARVAELAKAGLAVSGACQLAEVEPNQETA
jgi:hypothetical protein